MSFAWLLFLIIIAVLSNLAQDRYKYHNVFRVLLVILLAFITGFGGLTAADHSQYAEAYKVYNSFDNFELSFSSLLGRVAAYESGFMLLMILCNAIGLGEAGFFFVVAFFVLKAGAAAYYLVVVYICLSVVLFFVIQFSLKHTLHYDNSILWKQSYLPSLLTTALFIPVFFMPDVVHPSIKVILSLIYLCILEWLICLTKNERERLSSFVKEKLSRH